MDDLRETNGQDAILTAKPVCPLDGTYSIGRLNDNPECNLADADGHQME